MCWAFCISCHLVPLIALQRWVVALPHRKAPRAFRKLVITQHHRTSEGWTPGWTPVGLPVIPKRGLFLSSSTAMREKKEKYNRRNGADCSLSRLLLESVRQRCWILLCPALLTTNHSPLSFTWLVIWFPRLSYKFGGEKNELSPWSAHTTTPQVPGFWDALLYP
jgi:hypothetical protein